MTTDLRGWTPFYHITGCRQPAFYRRVRPNQGDPIFEESGGMIAFPDGKEPEAGEAARCGACGEAIALYDLACPP